MVVFALGFLIRRACPGLLSRELCYAQARRCANAGIIHSVCDSARF
ncbi:hypothetical protein HMPREF1585_00749 [Gardnerella vaginalis JCP8481B]|uniref:Uncharacterized protein n=1 Tax=Gardnerella vaginalis TaxID=2702 RepID=A0A133NV80_GARVA|nr:hypothetical protein HMPREF1585_00749 [Gardnerella vaginalis JCP8481B]KXA20194.1 hypothetical protein HMPREF3208_00845 [Gardnerella vaginalis]